MKMDIAGFVRLARPVNCLMASVAVLAGFAVSSGSISFGTPVLLAMAAAFLVCAAGQTVNDYFDHKIDAVLHPDRPIPNGNVKHYDALIFALLLFIAGNYLAAQINYIAFVIAAMISVLLFVYSAFMEKFKYIGNWVVALGTSLTLVFGATIARDFYAVSFLAALALFSNVGREIAKDFEDRKKGETGKITLPRLIGKKAKLVVLSLFFAAIALSYFVFFAGIFGNAFYLAVVSIANLAFIHAFLLLKNDSFEKAQKYCKLGMILALAAFFAGAI